MRGLLLLLLVAGVCGCGGSGEPSAIRESSTSEATTTDTQPDQPPTNVDELLANLPPFDVPASPEVDAYRRAAIGGFYDRCVTREDSAVKRAFARANNALLDDMPVYPAARFVNEFSIDHRDGNGCPEALGPATSYSSYRNYRLPQGTQGQDVTLYYERMLTGWAKTFASGHCEQTFTRGEALFAVRACSKSLSLTARALERRSPDPAPALPPRPTGDQYPLTTEDYQGPTEPSGYEAEPGESCERGQASGREGVVPIILPPSPGVEARIEEGPLRVGAATFDHSIVVEWQLGTVYGDCPPSELILSYPAVTAYTIHERVHTRSGVARMPLLDFVPRPKVLSATAVSVDGHYSRRVSVLIRDG